MIAPVMFCVLKSYMLSVARYLITFYPKRAGKLTKREVQHEYFPGGHPSEYYSRPATLNYGVLMGSGALVLE